MIESNQRVTRGSEILLAPYLGAIADQMSMKGVAPETLLAGTGLTAEELQREDLPVSPGQSKQILLRARQCGWDRESALTLGRSLDLGSHGFLGYAVQASASLGDALELAVRYFRIRTGLIEIDLYVDGQDAVLQFAEALPLEGTFPWLMDVLLGSIVRSCEQLFGGPPPAATQVRLSYELLPGHELLLAGFEGSLQGDCGFTQVRMPGHWLALPLPSADSNLVRLATRECERALSDLKESDGLIGQVRKLARANLSHSVGLEKVAEALLMTPRTLRRRLAEMGTSYQQIVEQLRYALAVDLLDRTQMPVETISSELGYADPSNFGRAFRRWTGMSPRCYRAARLSPPSDSASRSNLSASWSQ